VSNYRNVSLFKSFSKIYETVMQTRILKHHTKYNILRSEKYGFKVSLKTDSAIYKLTTEISNSMNIKLIVEGIFRRRQLQTNPVQLNLRRQSSVGSPGV
jgi:hypothetical protein